MNSIRKLITVVFALCSLGLWIPQASASVFLFQWVDTEPDLIGNTYQDGQLIQSVVVGSETYANGYGLWNGAVLTTNFDVRVNIYESDGKTLSDTWHLLGGTENSALQIPFNSDIEGQPLAALPEPTLSIVENGRFQTVLEFDVSNGDHYIWQFQSDVDSTGVPEPGIFNLFLLGLGALFSMRRKNSVP